MKYCTKCAYPENHPFGIIFDDGGVCSGCNVHYEKDTLDWNERKNKLIHVLNNNIRFILVAAIVITLLSSFLQKSTT